MFYDISVQTRKCSALIQVSLPDVGWWWECKARAVLLGTANLCPICQNRCGCTPPCINEEENTPRTPSCGLGRHPTVQAAFLLHLCSWTCFVLQPLYVRWGFWHFWKHQSCSSWLGSYGNTSLGFFFFAAHEAVVQDTMAWFWCVTLFHSPSGFFHAQKWDVFMVQNTWVREQRLLHNAEVHESELKLCRQLYICCLPILGLGNFHLLSCLGSMDFTFVYVAITRSTSVLPLWVIPIPTPPSNHSVPHANVLLVYVHHPLSFWKFSSRAAQMQFSEGWVAEVSNLAEEFTNWCLFQLLMQGQN